MTLSATDTRIDYAGNGSTVSFAVTFVFWDNSDLRVILRDSSGVDTVWTLGTQYNLTGGDGSTGTLTVVTTPTDYTPATGETLVIKSNLPDLQATDIPAGGPLPAETIETQFDKNVRLIQQRAEELSRATKFPETDPSSIVADWPAVSVRKDKLVSFDTTGKMQMLALGTNPPTDIGLQLVTATGGNTAATLSDRFGDILNLKRDFGAIGDGVTDDTTAVTNALASNRTVYIPAGAYIVKSALTMAASGTTDFFGDGPQSVIIFDIDTSTDGLTIGADVSPLAQPSYLHWRDLGLLGRTVRDVLRLNFVLDSVFDRIFVGMEVEKTMRYNVAIGGCIRNFFRFELTDFLTSVTAPGIGTFSYNDAASGGIRIIAQASMAVAVATNANVFDCRIAGGDYVPGTSAQFYQESQGSDGGNNTIMGVYEGARAGRAIEIYTSSKLSLRSIHTEGSIPTPTANGVLLNGTRSVVISDGLINGLDLVGCTETSIDAEIAVNDLTIDATSILTRLGSITINGGALKDSSASTILAGPGLKDFSSTVGLHTAASSFDPRNLLRNGSFERWLATGLPDLFSKVGSPTIAQTGVGKSDTRRHFNRFAVKVTTAAVNEGIGGNGVFLTPTTGDFFDAQGQWVWMEAWVYIPASSAVTNVYIRPVFTPSGDAPGPWGTTGGNNTGSTQDDTWVPLRITAKAANSSDTFMALQVLADVAGVFYVADCAMGFGHAVPHGGGLDLTDVGPFTMIEGRRLMIGNAAPTSGDYIQGDKMMIGASAVGTTQGWECTVSGNPGTWVARPNL